MAQYTYPNQRMINIHRERPEQDFLGIKNENWMNAAKDLKAHALMLYMYLASNANGFELALSPVAIQEAIGMPRSTFHDQFQKLVEKGYLVNSHGNTYEFYEIPRDVQTQNVSATSGLNNEINTNSGSSFSEIVYGCPQGITEINNINSPKNIIIDNKKSREEEGFYF